MNCPKCGNKIKKWSAVEIGGKPVSGDFYCFDCSIVVAVYNMGGLIKKRMDRETTEIKIARNAAGAKGR